MEFSRLRNIFVVLIISGFLSSAMLFVLEENRINLAKQTTAAILGSQNTSSPEPTQILFPPVNPPPKKLENPPEIIKAVYVTGYSAGSKNYLDYLETLFKTTEINAVVVDIKGSDGKTGLYDADTLIKFFHDKNIYVIGRIAVFEDPVYAKTHPEWAVYNKAKTTDLKNPVLWKDNNGLSWLDPASKDVWDYNISLAKDALQHGFDEINFDYVRYPSDGNENTMGFPVSEAKITSAQVIKQFFQYLRSKLEGERISVDLFGQTTTNRDDMGIGQLLENAFENFDYISPMVYPSHYINGFMGYKNPAQYPYEVTKYSMDGAKNREKEFLDKDKEIPGTPAEEAKAMESAKKLAEFRPWLQDFNMGADYTAEMVKKEIKATKDALGADYNGFMLWNPNNIYTKEAMSK